MEDLKYFWEKPVYLPYLQPKLTDEIVHKAELSLGYKLPDKLIELLKVQNGGFIRKTLKDFMNEQIYGIGPYFPSITDLDWTESKDWVSFELDGLIPFDGDGHWFICLDYRKNETNPQITYVDIECDNQIKIANSFSEYLSILFIDTNDWLVIKTDEPIKKIIVQLEHILKVKFEEPDNFNNGYDEYRTQLKKSWIWLSPNLVPNGFVREDDERYNELIELSKGQSLRFPEISPTDLIISFSDKNVENKSIEKLKKNSIEIKPLSNLL